MALANGKWIGNIPDELQNLKFAKQMLIAHIQHNKYIVQVSSGMYKMKANAIIFANSTPKIYNILPLSKDELDEVLAYIFTWGKWAITLCGMYEFLFLIIYILIFSIYC